MHELSIMLQVVESIDDILKENQPCKLKSFTLQIGEMTDVVPVFMENAWQSVKDSTPFGDADMIIENVPAVAQCGECGYKDKVSKFGFTCPECNSPDIKIVSGKEMLIKQAEIISV